MFTQNENFELIRIYFIIGKLKNGIIYKRLIPQQLFAGINLKFFILLFRIQSWNQDLFQGKPSQYFNSKLYRKSWKH